MANGISPLGLVAIAGGAIVLGIIVEREIGVKITGVTYTAGPGAQQATAAVALTNHTDTQSNYTLAGYQVTEADLTSAAPPTLGLSFLSSPETRFAKVASAGLVSGHWFSQPNIVAAGVGPANPTLAQQERAIAVSLPRGQSVTVRAYTATPENTSGVVNFWFLFAGTNVLSGVPAASWLDSAPEMPSA